MNRQHDLLRTIPKIDRLLSDERIHGLIAKSSRTLVIKALRAVTDDVRKNILNGTASRVDPDTMLSLCEAKLREYTVKHRCVINATGVLLHTNLGRAPLPQAAADAVRDAALNYTSLELNLCDGSRGDRCANIERLLMELLGAEAAVVVNNNAAAVLLMLAALAKGREVIVSRGELVEIGGSFRIPEVMEQGGCILREVGATNKTHPRDYMGAISPLTAALLKVHRSNYRIVGFVQEVSLDTLSRIAHAEGLPLLYDLGGGALLSLSRFGLSDEPTVGASLAQGADVVCFSGDKLVGGPQAGIIVGKAHYIEVMKKHPLMRALRPDKLTLSALETTLLLYEDADLAIRKIPVYSMLSQPIELLLRRAKGLLSMLLSADSCAIAYTRAKIGAGAAPDESIPSVAVAIKPQGIGVGELQRRLLHGETPILARISGGRLLLDMMAVRDGDVKKLAQAVEDAMSCGSESDGSKA